MRSDRMAHNGYTWYIAPTGTRTRTVSLGSSNPALGPQAQKQRVQSGQNAPFAVIHFADAWRGVCGLVVEYVVGIDLIRIPFPADAKNYWVKFRDYPRH